MWCLLYLQIGWVTLDNASNNDTMMESLERELKTRGIPFNRITHRIRYGDLITLIQRLTNFVDAFLT